MEKRFIRFPVRKNQKAKGKSIGKRGVGMELAVMTLLIVGALSILIVSSSIGNTLSRRQEETYTQKRLALTYMAESFEHAIRNGDLFAEDEFRSRNIFFNNVFPESKTYTAQSVLGGDASVSYFLAFYGEKGQTLLAVQIDKTKTLNSTSTVRRWEINP